MGNNTCKVANFRSMSQSLTLLFKSHMSLRPPCQPQSSNTIETTSITHQKQQDYLLQSNL